MQITQKLNKKINKKLHKYHISQIPPKFYKYHKQISQISQIVLFLIQQLVNFGNKNITISQMVKMLF